VEEDLQLLEEETVGFRLLPAGVCPPRLDNFLDCAKETPKSPLADTTNVEPFQ